MNHPIDQFPEHVKMEAVHSDAQIIGSFLEWLAERGVVMARWHEVEDEMEDEVLLLPDNMTIAARLALYFGIDLNKIEQEKRRMLALIRAAQGEEE